LKTPIHQPTDKTEAAASMAAVASGGCFHCGLPVVGDAGLSVAIDGELRDMCCPGCKAVAEALIAAGHEHYYRVRTEPANTGHEMIPALIREARIYDNAELQSQYVDRVSDGLCEASLILEGITCAACLWLNERHIESLPGVDSVRVNYATRRAWVRWDDSRIRLSEILLEVESIGYHALPYDPGLQQEMRAQERRRQLLGLGIAGLFGMQVMMLSFSLYAGAWSGMDDNFHQLFRWLGLGLTIPVLTYSALPFFRAAWSDVKNRRAGMDIPVSIALAIAFGASLNATITNTGEVYFDSVVMFVFLLLLSRFFEAMAGQRSAETIEHLAHALPVMATRLTDNNGADESVPAASLMPGDRVLIRPGEVVPADGEVIAGLSSLDESILSGESRALQKRLGEPLLGGSINLENPLQMLVNKVGSDTVLASIQRMMERAQSDKPGFSNLADRIAARFVVAVLIIAVMVASYWWYVDAEVALEITLATLIVSCPCALSLATPTAISAVMGKLQAAGLLLRRASSIETLAQVSQVVLDKTGTLTRALPDLVDFVCSDGTDRSSCFRIAASLERNSEHPLAKALMRACAERVLIVAQQLVHSPGAGISGIVEGERYYIGSIDFIARNTGLEIPVAWQDSAADSLASIVMLASSHSYLAMFSFEDSLRSDARALIMGLKADGFRIKLLSGDRQAAVARVAAQINVSDYLAEISPREKMQQVQALQSAGETVLMVGDGINDAPVLASADVSIAVADASSLARTSADILLLSDRLDNIRVVFDAAQRTRRVIRQNLGWALLYNATAIPAAAAGLISPWLAALGMSASSLLVVANALRLRR